jgi:hypothetical protein
LHELWDSRKNVACEYTPINSRNFSDNYTNFSNLSSATEWEDILGGLVVGHHLQGQLANDLSFDPGINIIKKRISSVRSSMVAKTLKLSSRLIMLTSGIEKFKELLSDYRNESTPELFASTEAEGFVKYLKCKALKVPYLNEILMLEMAIQAVSIYGNTQRIQFNFNPIPVINALVERRLPQSPCPGNFEIEITADSINLLQI